MSVNERRDTGLTFGFKTPIVRERYARRTEKGDPMKDPIVDEVRRVRGEHAARFHYDLWAIFRDIKEQQERSGLKFVSFADEPPQELPLGSDVASPTS
jgi:hypothetical protein